MTLLVALVGALGTVISAYVVTRVRVVEKAVNGHVKELEARIDELRRQLQASASSPEDT